MSGTISLFPDYALTRKIATHQWSREDTARVIASAEHRARNNLADWDAEAAKVAKVMGWTNYKAKALLFGSACVTKRTNSHTIRYERWYDHRNHTTRYELTTCRKYARIGYGVYPSGVLAPYHCRVEDCSLAEKTVIEAVFLKALLKMSMVGVIPTAQMKLYERTTAHERVTLALELSASGFADEEILHQ